MSAGSALIYRVIFQSVLASPISLLDMNISWSSTPPTPPGVTVHFPTGTFPDVTPRLNVSVDTLAHTIWYNLDGGTNITLCTNCYSSSNVFLYVNETASTVNVYANNTGGSISHMINITVLEPVMDFEYIPYNVTLVNNTASTDMPMVPILYNDGVAETWEIWPALPSGLNFSTTNLSLIHI